MHERDDCESLRHKTKGQTILCAYLIEQSPNPTVQDHTGVLQLHCKLPDDSDLEVGGLFLFHIFYDQEGQQSCNRITPIPKVLYGVYKQLLDNFRDEKTHFSF
ncbi:unnamed protein product [Caenorhabditis angaria]|uniref:Uncharacterized protein n=1 Tax=Caenorhabditis angaria TaxID=860376 RepID=A0A9P1IRH8_9PELO|nr:unnamed protein product [Caenorhabditis angaria]